MSPLSTQDAVSSKAMGKYVFADPYHLAFRRSDFAPREHNALVVIRICKPISAERVDTSICSATTFR